MAGYCEKGNEPSGFVRREEGGLFGNGELCSTVLL